jgi:hypothetical protein
MHERESRVLMLRPALTVALDPERPGKQDLRD